MKKSIFLCIFFPLALEASNEPLHTPSTRNAPLYTPSTYEASANDYSDDQQLLTILQKKSQKKTYTNLEFTGPTGINALAAKTEELLGTVPGLNPQRPNIPTRKVIR